MAKRLSLKAGKKKRLAMKRGQHMMPGMAGLGDMPKGMMAQLKRKKKRRKGRNY